MSKANALYPYAFSEALGLRLSEFDDPASGVRIAVREIGSDAAADDAAAPENAVVAYDTSSSEPWHKLTFRLTATLPDEELALILPSTTHVEADTALIVLITCSATRYRHSVRLRRDKAGRWSGHATIQRHDVKGSLSLGAKLVRTTSIPADEQLPYATRTGSVVSIAEVVIVYLDLQQKLGLNAAVAMYWEDFANSTDPWRREHSDDVYHLEPFNEPRLWLNARYGPIRDVLESTAKRGPQATLRDMAAAMIAQPVMLQLCTSAIGALEVDEDSGTVGLPAGWRGDLLKSVLPRLYPEEPADDDRQRRAANEFREVDGTASLLARLGSVVQEMMASYKSIESAVRTFESVGEREETRDD